ncbi:MAG: hypothetical protein Q4D04_15755, partial [Clostridia bacterium]|nr:hypothetical protein [Clostridia bacterium]
MKKRFISILMAFIMALTAIPAAWAQEDSAAAAAELAASIRGAYAGVNTASEDEQAAAMALMEVTSMEEAEVDMYAIFSAARDKQTVNFFNGNKSVAYAEMDELFELLTTFMATDPDYSLECVYGDRFYLATRENGNYALIDFADGTVVFSDYDMFGRSSAALSGGDVLSVNPWQTDEAGNIRTDENGEPLVNLIKRVDNAYNFTRYGYRLAMQLALGHIPIY